MCPAAGVLRRATDSLQAGAGLWSSADSTRGRGGGTGRPSSGQPRGGSARNSPGKAVSVGIVIHGLQAPRAPLPLRGWADTRACHLHGCRTCPPDGQHVPRGLVVPLEPPDLGTSHSVLRDSLGKRHAKCPGLSAQGPTRAACGCPAVHPLLSRGRQCSPDSTGPSPSPG